MRKPLASRIIGLAVIYCVAFCVLVIIQFSNKGNFTLSTGGMTIRGHYLESEDEDNSEAQAITGGVKLFFGGIEFTLKQERGKGLTITGDGGARLVNPEYLIHAENSASFIMPGGTVITFNSFDTARGTELQITAGFADNTSSVTVPISPRRSSLVRESDQLGIMYNGSRYLFSSRGQELQEGQITLSIDNSTISYRSRGVQKIFDPDDYITASAKNYESSLTNWRTSSYNQLNSNAAALQNEDEIIAYLAEAILRGNYNAATGAIPDDFMNSARKTYRSSGYIGGMTNAHRSFTASENERINLITRLTREKSPAIFNEEHLIDFLFTRGNTSLAFDIIDIIQNTSPETLISDYASGLLEAYSDIRYWQPTVNNPIEHLSDQILVLVSENLSRDSENDLVLASNSGGVSIEYSLRLGKALDSWGKAAGNMEWEQIGKSLVLSALASAGPRAGNLQNILDYYPRAVRLEDNGIWAWTVSRTASSSYVSGNLNISFAFPSGSSHYVMIRGIRPFIKIQIHEMDWRTDSQFERYDSSGWIYYPQDQILIVKLRHRSTIENITVFYRVEAARPVIQEADETDDETEAATDTGDNADS